MAASPSSGDESQGWRDESSSVCGDTDGGQSPQEEQNQEQNQEPAKEPGTMKRTKNQQKNQEKTRNLLTINSFILVKINLFKVISDRLKSSL